MAALKLYNKRMLEVLDYLKHEKGVKYIESCAKMNYTHTNLNSIRSGKNTFTLSQMDMLIKAYNLNPVYFFKAKEISMFDKPANSEKLLEKLPELKKIINEISIELNKRI